MSAAAPTASSASSIRPRRVRFEWTDTPLHWIPGDPQTTHTMNVLHLLLPAGERWFCEVYRQALPLITDDQLRADVKGFIGQEAVHSRAHSAVLDHLRDQGLDPAPFTDRIEHLFTHVLGDAPFGLRLRGPFRRGWLRQRLAIIAAIEHYTAAMGDWVVRESAALDAAGADPTMLDLLRWHGAEEVEHRSVAFDLFQHVSGSYLRRVGAMVGTTVNMTLLFVLGTRWFLAHDPTGPGKATWRGYAKAARAGRMPRLRTIYATVPDYLRRDHHPSTSGSTAAALAYLATSPAALAAAPAPGAAEDAA